ncbi:MAG: hypothetical protein NZM11_04880 [Anaerolineales bacterium]|nr:hypothetical protein [Anaerolineales bacterium]
MKTLRAWLIGIGVLPLSARVAAPMDELRAPLTLSVNQSLNIPAVRRTNIGAGSVWAAHFCSPFPGLLTVSATASATATGTWTAKPTTTPYGTATPTDTPTLTATPTFDPKQGFFRPVSNVSPNAGGNTITVEPGSPIAVSVDFQIWNAADCPRCTAQTVNAARGHTDDDASSLLSHQLLTTLDGRLLRRH